MFVLSARRQHRQHQCRMQTHSCRISRRHCLIPGVGPASSTGPCPLLHGLRVRACVRAYNELAKVTDRVCVFGVQVGRSAGEVENEDVTLAIASRTRHSFVPRPPQETLQQLADQVRGCVVWSATLSRRAHGNRPTESQLPRAACVRR